MDLEIERYAHKLDAGAEFVFSQPVYDPSLLTSFVEKTKDLPKIPFYIGLLPLISLRNAEFLHNEVPGMQIPKNVMAKMASAKTDKAQEECGMAIAKDALAAAISTEGVNGAYIFPPFGRYSLVGELLKVIR
jgi:homocysteine S-methyltransferase